MELLALPLRRIFSKQEGELDAAVDGDRRDLLSKAHEFVQRLCADNTAAQVSQAFSGQRKLHTAGGGGADVAGGWRSTSSSSTARRSSRTWASLVSSAGCVACRVCLVRC